MCNFILKIEDLDVQNLISQMRSAKDSEVLEGLRGMLNMSFTSLKQDELIQIWSLVEEKVLTRSDATQIKILGKAIQGKIIEVDPKTAELFQSKDMPKDISSLKSQNEKFCCECGQIINKKAEICPKCGVRQPLEDNMCYQRPKRKDRITAALFAIFLGNIGFHKFYVGDNNTGILYLCFCWTFIPGFIGLVEGIVLLGKTDVEFQQEYIKYPSGVVK